jgi:hypothetical protein
VDVLVKRDRVSMTSHPTYQDPGLTAMLGKCFESGDKRFLAVYWDATGPGRLLEEPQIDELICIIEGRALVEWHGEKAAAGPGDVILWLVIDPPVVVVEQNLFAFCVTYNPA